MLEAKIKSLKEIKDISIRLHALGKRIVFTNGCFDLIHYGHVKYLEEAKKKGDVLVVAVNSDRSLRQIKGSKRPIVKQDYRIRIIAALESVDYVVLFHQSTPLETIKIVKPDILVKGADWKKNDIVGASFLISCGGKVSNIKLVRNQSTTALIKKIARIF